MDAIDYRTHVNEIHGRVGAVAGQDRRRRGARIQFGVPARRRTTVTRPPIRPRTRGRTAVQKAVGSREHLPGAERRVEFATRSLVELGKIDRAVALVTQDFDEGGPAFFGWGLKLAVNDAQEVHLQGLDLEILCVSAVRTRK